jgi:hypothetical protein
MLACIIPEGTENSGKVLLVQWLGIAGSYSGSGGYKILIQNRRILVGKILFVDMKIISFNTMNIKVNPKCKNMFSFSEVKNV